MEKLLLGDLVTFQRGFDLPKEKIIDGPYPVVSSNSIIGYHNKFKSSSSIVIGRSGSIGKPQLILSKFWPHNTALYIKDFKNNNILYIYYFLLYFNTEKLKTGSNIPTLNRNHLHKLNIYVETNVNKQKIIADILYKIDKQIILNNKTNSELEQMAKTLYNYWFIQFDFPDENGRPYKSSGGKMVWNEELKKEIPEGWEVENLANNSLSAIIPVGIEYFNKKNYLETKNINNELISDGAWISYDNRENRANMQPELNSIWFAKMKKSIKHITLPNNSKWFIDKYILSTGFFGIKCIYDAFSYIHCFINSDYFEAKKNILAHGATQKAVNNQDLERIPLIIPPTNLLKAFNSKIYNLLEMKLNIIKTNQELTSLRDFLLPLLMNGQAVIKE